MLQRTVLEGAWVEKGGIEHFQKQRWSVVCGATYVGLGESVEEWSRGVWQMPACLLFQT